jgi:hypothetical protein
MEDKKSKTNKALSEDKIAPFSEERIVAIEMVNSAAGVYRDVAFSFAAGAQIETFEGLANDLISAGHAVLKSNK